MYDWVHHDREEYIKRNHYQPRLLTLLVKGKKQAWKLVRNPYHRAVSSFLHTVLHKKKLGVSMPGEAIAFKPYLYWVKRRLKNHGAIDPHIAPQYIEGEETTVRHYLYLEQFNQQIRKLEKQYGLRPSPLSSITRSPHHKSNKMTLKGAFAEVPFSREYVSRGGELPTIESLYNSETRQLVREIYQKDFVMYKYLKR